jgi:UDP-N-acetyl-D-mannosaminuronic acid dehydrogenase
MASNSKIVVVGTGYVGLPAAILLARAGFQVLGVDTNEAVVASLNAGQVHIDEEGLRELFALPAVRANLRASAGVEPADAFLIAVPTPLEHPRNSADLSMVEAACEALLPHLRKGSLVVLESTVPPLTCRRVITPILERSGLKVGRDLLLAHCPERILPGNVLHEIVHNDRIIGGVDRASTEAAMAIYGSFVKGELIQTDDVTAELCKLMENTYRDVNIALANELAKVASTLGVDIRRALEIANRHPRVNLLHPGIGVGGHCIPIDPWFIAEVAPGACTLIPAARKINDDQPERTAKQIRRAVAGLVSPRILCIGATYKADTYDLRESPALEVVHSLREDGYDVRLVDPITREYPCPDLVAAADGTDLVVVLVPHRVVMAELGARRAELARGMRRARVVDASGGALSDLSPPS